MGKEQLIGLREPGEEKDADARKEGGSHNRAVQASIRCRTPIERSVLGVECWKEVLSLGEGGSDPDRTDWLWDGFAQEGATLQRQETLVPPADGLCGAVTAGMWLASLAPAQPGPARDGWGRMQNCGLGELGIGRVV